MLSHSIRGENQTKTNIYNFDQHEISVMCIRTDIKLKRTFTILVNMRILLCICTEIKLKRTARPSQTASQPGSAGSRGGHRLAP